MTIKLSPSYMPFDYIQMLGRVHRCSRSYWLFNRDEEIFWIHHFSYDEFPVEEFEAAIKVIEEYNKAWDDYMKQRAEIDRVSTGISLHLERTIIQRLREKAERLFTND